MKMDSDIFQWITVLDKDTCSRCHQRSGKLFTRVQLEKLVLLLCIQ